MSATCRVFEVAMITLPGTQTERGIGILHIRKTPHWVGQAAVAGVSVTLSLALHSSRKQPCFYNLMHISKNII